MLPWTISLRYSQRSEATIDEVARLEKFEEEALKDLDASLFADYGSIEAAVNAMEAYQAAADAEDAEEAQGGEGEARRRLLTKDEERNYAPVIPGNSRYLLISTGVSDGEMAAAEAAAADISRSQYQSQGNGESRYQYLEGEKAWAKAEHILHAAAKEPVSPFQELTQVAFWFGGGQGSGCGGGGCCLPLPGLLADGQGSRFTVSWVAVVRTKPADDMLLANVVLLAAAVLFDLMIWGLIWCCAGETPGVLYAPRMQLICVMLGLSAFALAGSRLFR